MEKKFPLKRFLVMVFGLIIMGIGVALFELSILGNDPCTAFAFGLGNILKKNVAAGLIIINGVCFIFEIFFAKKMIGLGTFFNWFGAGFMEMFWKKVLTSIFTFPEAFFGRFIVMVLGVIILSLSVALYQTPDLGVAPYDSVSIVLSKRFSSKYFWCRIATDVICTIGALLTGSIVNIGTAFCALGLGPFVSFFTKTVAKPLLGDK